MQRVPSIRPQLREPGLESAHAEVKGRLVAEIAGMRGFQRHMHMKPCAADGLLPPALRTVSTDLL